MYKPHLACDVNLDKLKFPICVLPKIDGVCAVNPEGQLYGRSLKRFANKHTNRIFSGVSYAGFKGELAAGLATDSDLCRKTTSATSTIEGEPDLTWHIFDICAVSVADAPFKQRWEMARAFLEAAHEVGELLDLEIVPMHIVDTMEELLEWENIWLDMGYEGIIIRDPNGPYKHGRATMREGAFLRLKRFIEEDAIVVSIEEGETNTNEAQINELGQTFRSSHQENMVPNGMVGALNCKDVKTGNPVKVSAGAMPHDDRYFYFKNPDKIVGHTIKYKHFPKGVKDKPRFAQFVSIRDVVDMVSE